MKNARNKTVLFFILGAVSLNGSYLQAQQVAAGPYTPQNQQSGPFSFDYRLGQNGADPGQNAAPDATLSMCMDKANSIKGSSSSGTGSFTDLIGAGGDLASSIGNAAAGASSGVAAGISGGVNAFNSTQDCTGALDVPSYGSCSDPDLKLGDDFSEKKSKDALASIDKILKKANCQDVQNLRAGILAGCFKDYFNSLTSDMQKLQSVFAQNKEKFNNYITQVDAKIDTVNQTSTAVDSKISSLNEVRNQLEAAKASLNGVASKDSKTNLGSVAGLTSRVNDFKVAESAFKSQQTKLGFSRAADCLKGSGSVSTQFSQCQKSDTETFTVIECLAVMRGREVYDTLRNGSNGDNSMRKKGDAAKADFQASMNRILGELYSDNPRFTSVAQLLAARGNELSRFGAWSGYFTNELNKCDAQAQQSIQTELKDTSISGGLGQQAAALKKSSGDIASDMGSALSSLDSTLRNGVKELFKAEPGAAVGTPQCSTNVVLDNSGSAIYSSTSLDTQLKCMNDMRSAVTQMLDGSGGVSGAVPVNVSLGFVDPSTNQTVYCSYIRDCISKSEVVKTNVTQKLAQMQGSGTFTDPTLCAQYGGTCMGKKGFIQQSNTQIRQAMQSAASDFTNRVAIARARLLSLKNILGPYGLSIDEPKKTGRLTSDDACPKSDSEICAIPKDMDQLIGDMAGIPNVSDEQFVKVKDEADAKSKTAKAASAEATKSMKNLKELIAKCKNDDKKAKVTKNVNKKIGEINKLVSSCKKKARLEGATKPMIDSKVEDLVNSIEELCNNAPSGADLEGCSKVSSLADDSEEECMAVYNQTKESEAVRGLASARGYNSGEGNGQSLQLPPDAKASKKQ